MNVHLLTEYLAFFIAFRYYLYLRKRSQDTISSNNRLSIILGATIGALVGSRLIGFLENPLFDLSWKDIITLWNLKTIMGGLFGGLLGVELAKKIIGEKQRSGDLFTLPIILGIFIGRIGCFLSGTDEFTYGLETSFFTGMDLGDGIMRHPIALYELVFLIILFIIIKHIQDRQIYRSGMVFKIFMISYFGFRFMIEFMKPNLFFVLGLSSIQWLCIVCWAYYLPFRRWERQIFTKEPNINI
ncbi:prolipoprotein diacylglyceryl transferase family protein [Fulvivirga maritima]|uniref:prolipoprotein diacylglyceryl transferase family protein n=1 Tax=Fulvivirga maritima TaxID=2904247 RepID=UPI002795A77E|nr:prolipoprotein diacylglyceryl transferase family protein [Fulvivirga maritima]